MDFFAKPTSIYEVGVILLFLFSVLETAFIYWKILKVVDRKHEFNLTKQMSANQKVSNIMSELRALIKADRISLIRFHNGTEFLPNNPIWKITSDNQVTSDGITDEHIEGVLVSRIQPIIEPLITGEAREEGILIPESCAKCPNLSLCKDSNSRIVRFNVDDMTGFTKIFLQKRGTKTAFMATLNNSEKRIFGVLMIEYTDDVETLKQESQITQTICAFTEKLRFLFN